MSDGIEVGDSAVSADGDAAVAGPATAPRARDPLRVLLLSLETAARQLPRLAIPTIAVMVPMALAVEVAYLLTIGHDGNIVNGHLVAFSASTAMLVVTIVAVAAGLVGVTALEEGAHVVDLGGLCDGDLLGHVLDDHVGALGELLLGHRQGALVMSDH
jgi:hypothetical protein